MHRRPNRAQTGLYQLSFKRAYFSCFVMLSDEKEKQITSTHHCIPTSAQPRKGRRLQLLYVEMLWWVVCASQGL